MAVNLSVPLASELKPVSGLELGYAKANIKKADRKDLLVMKLAPEATVAGVFTKNRFCRRACQDLQGQSGKTAKDNKPIPCTDGQYGQCQCRYR